MKKLNYLLLTALLLFFSFSTNAQTVDEIIENYIENTGGAENWAKVKSIKMNILTILILIHTMELTIIESTSVKALWIIN